MKLTILLLIYFGFGLITSFSWVDLRLRTGQYARCNLVRKNSNNSYSAACNAGPGNFWPNVSVTCSKASSFAGCAMDRDRRVSKMNQNNEDYIQIQQ